jgi:hypothetical protein
LRRWSTSGPQSIRTKRSAAVPSGTSLTQVARGSCGYETRCSTLIGMRWRDCRDASGYLPTRHAGTLYWPTQAAKAALIASGRQPCRDPLSQRPAPSVRAGERGCEEFLFPSRPPPAGGGRRRPSSGRQPHLRHRVPASPSEEPPLEPYEFKLSRPRFSVGTSLFTPDLGQHLCRAP